jgi:hypothetical protein
MNGVGAEIECDVEQAIVDSNEHGWKHRLWYWKMSREGFDKLHKELDFLQ